MQLIQYPCRSGQASRCLTITWAVLAAASAPAADIDTSLAGFVKSQFALANSGRPAAGNFGARLDGEAHIQIDGQTDTGIAYGGRLQLLLAAKARDNGTYADIAWAWGEFRLGDYGGAARELSVSAPTVGIGQIDGDLDRFGGPSALIAPYALNNDNSTKLTYLSPAVFGYRFGLSFSPELTGGGVAIVPGRHIAAIDAHRTVTEIAIGSARDIGTVTVTSGLAAVFGAAKAGAHLHDLAGGSAGVKLAWNDLTLGGAFIYDGAGTLPLDRRPGHVGIDSIISEFNLGASYVAGSWSFGASWAHDYRKALPSGDVLSAGLSYRIVRGVTIGADLSHFTRPRGQRRTDGTALLAQAALHF